MLLRNFILGLVVATGSVALADSVSIRGDQWCPFNCKPGSGKEGYMIEMAKEILTKSGHTVDYQELNWSRTLTEVKEGKFMAAVGASADDAKDLIITKESMGKSQSCFFGKESETWTYTGPASLESKSITIVKDYVYGSEIDPYIKKNSGNIKRIDIIGGDDTLPRNSKKVLGGRVDLLLEDKNVVGYHMSQTSEKLKNVGCLKENNDIYIAISKKHPKGSEISNLLDKGITELRKDGRLKEILSKYGLTDWK